MIVGAHPEFGAKQEPRNQAEREEAKHSSQIEQGILASASRITYRPQNGNRQDSKDKKHCQNAQELKHLR
jgi:hypothetical protein